MTKYLESKWVQQTSKSIEFLVLFLSLLTLMVWLSGRGLFYSDTSPVLSPFTSFSLFLMIAQRIATRYLDTWSKTMSLAILGIVACGNISSLLVQLMTPELFLVSMPTIVPTSPMTSFGLILFSFYEILVTFRKTPKTAFIVDDILLHLALFPGGLSLLGLIMGNTTYTSSTIDPRSGVSFLEVFLMGSYVLTAMLSNRDLFLWEFLSKRNNQLIFVGLVVNQYALAYVFGIFFRDPSLPPNGFGIEFYMMLAGVLATLLFLLINAILKNDWVK